MLEGRGEGVSLPQRFSVLRTVLRTGHRANAMTFDRLHQYATGGSWSKPSHGFLGNPRTPANIAVNMVTAKEEPKHQQLTVPSAGSPNTQKPRRIVQRTQRTAVICTGFRSKHPVAFRGLAAKKAPLDPWSLNLFSFGIAASAMFYITFF